MHFPQRVLFTFLFSCFTVWGSGCCCLDYCCDDGGCGARRHQRPHGVGAALWGDAHAGGCGTCGMDAPGCVAGGCGYPIGPRRPFCRASAAAGWTPDYPALDAGWVPCRGPILSFFAGVRDLFASASCGCGGYYFDEWYNDPPACHDPCLETCGTNGGISYGADGYMSGAPMHAVPSTGSDCGCNGTTSVPRAHQPRYASSPKGYAPPSTTLSNRPRPAERPPQMQVNRPRPAPRVAKTGDHLQIEPVAYDQR